jgi:myo-inositol-1(or 4)-monophosphatase
MNSQNQDDHYVKLGLAAALAGAKIAETSLDRNVISQKGNIRDIVTLTDQRISELLIHQLTPTGIPVMSEEKISFFDEFPGEIWVIDPIDGSVNFSNGLPLYSISIGLMQDSHPKLGFVCIPSLDELYFTLSPTKALLNGKPFIHEHVDKACSLIAASFSAKPLRTEYDLFQAVNEKMRGCLRTGSAALNICWAASGKLQGAYGFQAKLWDVVGALAIAKAAGCEVIIEKSPNSLLIDYCVGSKDVVSYISKLATEMKLLNL